MTKKDYELIASAIKQAKVMMTTIEELRGVHEVESYLITALEEENPCFNKNKFVEASSN